MFEVKIIDPFSYRRDQMYTHASLILTSNVPFDRWAKVFGGDEVIVAAILDRLLHYSHVFLISGPSFRMKGKLTGIEKATELRDDTS